MPIKANSTLPDELRVFLQDDPRTLSEIKASEEFEDSKITDVKDDDGYWFVTSDNGFSVGLKKEWAEERDVAFVAPYVGASMRSYSKGFGSPVTGVDIDGIELFYRTPYQQLADRIMWLANYDHKRRRDAELNAEHVNEDYEGLPAALKLRIDRFRRESPTFAIDSEGYEMFCCVEAAKIAEYLRPRVEAGEDIDAVFKAFVDDFDDQKKVPIDGGHSGNTFGGAVSLAYGLLSGKLEKMERENLV